MSSISALPTPFISSLTPADATPTTGTTSTGSSASSANQTSVTALGSTFLQLLTQELQNQDPTAPVDSTAMVGQMISLNQLDQLAGINNTLTNQFPTAAAGTATSGLTGGGTSADLSAATGAATAAATQSSISAAIQAALQALNTGAATNVQNSLVSLPTL